jgi:hypothetical protein
VHYVRQTYPCEDYPEGFCGRYWLPESAELYFAVATSHKLNLNFNREPNALDVTLPLNIRAEAASNPDDVVNFSNCMQSLAASAKAKIK